jgi:hypothetical protein
LLYSFCGDTAVSCLASLFVAPETLNKRFILNEGILRKIFYRSNSDCASIIRVGNISSVFGHVVYSTDEKLFRDRADSDDN